MVNDKTYLINSCPQLVMSCLVPDITNDNDVSVADGDTITNMASKSDKYNLNLLSLANLK